MKHAESRAMKNESRIKKMEVDVAKAQKELTVLIATHQKKTVEHASRISKLSEALRNIPSQPKKKVARKAPAKKDLH